MMRVDVVSDVFPDHSILSTVLRLPNRPYHWVMPALISWEHERKD